MRAVGHGQPDMLASEGELAMVVFFFFFFFDFSYFLSFLRLVSWSRGREREENGRNPDREREAYKLEDGTSFGI